MPDRRTFLATSLAAVSLATLSQPALAGLVGQYSLLIKTERDRVHESVRMSLQWAGISVQNNPL